VGEAIEFDWDEHNLSHLKSHRVSSTEFEEVITGDPIGVAYQSEGGEERYKSLGVTRRGRMLIVVWTLRQGRVRAVTAYSAGKSYEKLYWEVKK
jgi:uncharacterized DUF497 family protein